MTLYLILYNIGDKIMNFKSYSFVLLLILGLVFSLLAQENEKLRIAVIDLNHTGGLSQEEAVTLTNRLRSRLVITNAFVVLERGQMEVILKEQGFQNTGCTTTECAVEMGKLLNVQRIVSGSIGQVGKIYTVDISLIDIRTAKIEESFIFDHSGEIGGLVKMMEIVANDIANRVTGQKPATEVVKTGSVVIESDPKKAEVYLDNNLIGNAPVSLKEVTVGPHTIKVMFKGFDTEEKEIVVNTDKETKLKIELKKLYKLSVNSTPTGAQVLINNKSAGQTPYSTTIKKGMQFDLKLSLENYKDWSKRIKVKDNINLNEKLEYTDVYKDQLEKQARLAAEKKKSEEAKTDVKESKGGGSKWYWIGGAVAVIGGVTYYFLSQGDDSSSDEGMPNPPGRP